MADLTGKPCSTCKELKSPELMSKSTYYCKDCDSARTKEWYLNNKNRACKKSREWHANNKDRVADKRLKRRFGISLKQYNELNKKQQGLCAICSKECFSGNKLAVDHCHRTGEVRGLLCRKCNQGLGLLGDTLESIKITLEYLENKHG